MNLTPLYESSLTIQLHVYAAIFAVVIGFYILAARKGTFRHKAAGRAWVLVMICVALSSFGIHEIQTIGWFSPIHLLSILVLVSLYRSILAIRKGDVKQHQSSMKWLFFAGLLLPGLFTLLPGRLISEVLFSAPS